MHCPSSWNSFFKLFTAELYASLSLNTPLSDKGENLCFDNPLGEPCEGGEVEAEVRKEYEVKLQQWIQENEKRIREDAIQKSLATILGKVGEELAPLIIFANYGIEPKDLRRIGSPVDYIAFKGYSKGGVEEIIFFEVKTGKSSRLTDVEKSVRDAIASGKVRHIVINIREELEKLQTALAKQRPEETAEQTPE
jgi:predicted Holliday junction resolvase-like endonuclease